MQCDNCNERPAAIHLTQIVDNSVTTVHLCEQCAAEKGVQTGASTAKFPISGLMASVGQGAAALLHGEDDSTCGFCGARLQDFRETGRLGCSHCYETFEQLREYCYRVASVVGLSCIHVWGFSNEKARHPSARVRAIISSVVIFTVAAPRSLENLGLAASPPFLFTRYTRPLSSMKSTSVDGVIIILSRMR